VIAANDRPRRSWALPLLGGLIGGALMTAALGPSVVDPTHFEWLMHGDYALHFLGWHLYRHGPWTAPLGAAPLLIAPIGSSIGLTDSIPLVGIPLKVFDALLPPIFQFIGPWLVLSVALQGVFGVLLMRLVTPRASLQLLGATLIVLSPPLFYRINHAALTAHWLVLAALWLSLRDDADVPSARLAAAWALLAAATAATQPYILLMVMVLMGAAHARQVLSAPSRILRIALHAALAVAAAGVALWQSGSLMVRAEDGLEVGGFGSWSSNLLAFIMPTEGFTLLYPGPFRYEHKEQYEGYAYLGLGMLFLLAVVIAGRIASWRMSARPRRLLWYVPLGLALLFLGAMALGPTITAGQRTLFAYDMSWWGPLRIFRTSGRMIWPVYYTTVIAILFALSRFEHRRAVFIASIAIVIQAVDLAGMVRYLRDVQAFGFRDPLENRFWSVVPQHYDDLVLIPPNFCAQEGYLDFGPFALRAGLHGVSINSGMTARFDVRRARVYCRALGEEIRTGVRPDRSLYVVRPDIVADMMKPDKTETMCSVIDGYGVCFSAASYARWRDVFDLPRSRLPDTAEFVRFYKELDDTYGTVLGRAEHEIDGSTEARIEGLVSYLSLRMEGCDHVEAEQRTIGRLDGEKPSRLCSAISMNHELPPVDQTFAFRKRLSGALEGRAAPGRTHVDVEGEAVWLHAYARERARGAREVDARATVLAAIRGSK
jgi:Family of unknown function (DUF6311)